MCGLCGEKITRAEDLSQAHLCARSKGGQTVPENLIISHKKCNEEMGTMTIKEWYLLWNYRHGISLKGYK